MAFDVSGLPASPPSNQQTLYSGLNALLAEHRRSGQERLGNSQSTPARATDRHAHL
jgi:hypothetical protein